ncbi:MAG: NAD(P)-dependent oxidoreductase [bacterium]
MKAFPVGFVTSGRHLLIVGGGAITEGRIKHALKFDWARIRVIFPPSDKALPDLASDDTRVELSERAVMESDVTWAHLVIEDSGSRSLAEQLDRWCEDHRVPLNAMDTPDLSDIYYVSLLFREPLVVAISSGGEAPALSSFLRKYLDERIGPGWAMAAKLLSEARKSLPIGQTRVDVLKSVVNHERFPELIQHNDEAGLKHLLDDELRRVRT